MKKRSSADALITKAHEFIDEILVISASTKHQSIKIEIMNVLKEMSWVLPQKLAEKFSGVLPFIKQSFASDTSSAL